MAAAEALEYPKTNSKNCNKEELHFTFAYLLVKGGYIFSSVGLSVCKKHYTLVIN